MSNGDRHVVVATKNVREAQVTFLQTDSICKKGTLHKNNLCIMKKLAATTQIIWRRFHRELMLGAAITHRIRVELPASLGLREYWNSPQPWHLDLHYYITSFLGNLLSPGRISRPTFWDLRWLCNSKFHGQGCRSPSFQMQFSLRTMGHVSSTASLKRGK